MTIDADKLRALLEKALSGSERDKADCEAAAVNALPELLAVYEAACAWRDASPPCREAFADRDADLTDAIDAARGER